MNIQLKTCIIITSLIFFSAQSMNLKEKNIIEKQIKTYEQSKKRFENTIKTFTMPKKPEPIDLKNRSGSEFEKYVKEYLLYATSEELLENSCKGYNEAKNMIEKLNKELAEKEQSINNTSIFNIENYSQSNILTTILLISGLFCYVVVQKFPGEPAKLACAVFLLVGALKLADFMADKY